MYTLPYVCYISQLKILKERNEVGLGIGSMMEKRLVREGFWEGVTAEQRLP